MTRSLCKSSNYVRPSVDDGLKGLLRNISHHVAKSRNERTRRTPQPQESAACSSCHDQSSPVSSIDQSSWYTIGIPSSCDWSPLSKSSRKRNVTFSEKVSTRFTTSLQEVTTQELAALWYSAEEYDEITQACSKQIDRLDRGELLKDRKFCARGLECHTHVRSIAKALNRSMAYKAVLEEQHRQAKEGVIHYDAIARVYHDVSSSCQIWAHAVALTDQREAECIQEDR